MKPCNLFFLIILTFGLAKGSSPAEVNSADMPSPFSPQAQNYKEWRKERSHRQKAINEYFKNNAENAKALIVDANGIGPVPMIMFRLFNDLFPEIWGTENEHYAPIGLSKNIFSPQSVLPLGMGYAVSEETLASYAQGPVKINKVGFNCVACHAGQVQITSNKTIPLIGAPNTRINFPLLLFAKTSQLPNFTAEKFREVLAKKPVGWIYKDAKMLEVETKERQLFNTPGVAEELVANVKANSDRLLGGFDFYRKFAYKENSPDPFALKRGSMDVLTTTYLAFLAYAKENDPDALKPENIINIFPAQAAEIDAPSIWNQRDRGPTHWDGSTAEPLHRNIGAAAATLIKPVSVENVFKVTEFTKDLPSNPYPFDVDMNRARRGEKIFATNCLSCHSSKNKVFDSDLLGTDSNRVNHFTPTAAKFLGGLYVGLCTDPARCNKPDGTSYLPDELSFKTNGYVAGRLDGIWARAPYLHNGSVPTLYALLTNDRPTKFYRGALTYDQQKVGFTWDKNLKGTVEYNTLLDGNSNKGHSDLNYLGLDWKSHPAELKDLIEYMKTL